jgi:hypothetical protein
MRKILSRWLCALNSEAGHVRGTVTKVHTKDVPGTRVTHRCSAEDPQYEIPEATQKADHVAMHGATRRDLAIPARSGRV